MQRLTFLRMKKTRSSTRLFSFAGECLQHLVRASWAEHGDLCCAQRYTRSVVLPKINRLTEYHCFVCSYLFPRRPSPCHTFLEPVEETLEVLRRIDSPISVVSGVGPQRYVLHLFQHTYILLFDHQLMCSDIFVHSALHNQRVL